MAKPTIYTGENPRPWIRLVTPERRSPPQRLYLGPTPEGDENCPRCQSIQSCNIEQEGVDIGVGVQYFTTGYFCTVCGYFPWDWNTPRFYGSEAEAKADERKRLVGDLHYALNGANPDNVGTRLLRKVLETTSILTTAR
jgi:hypothetical protein